ncbi:hypothetical protein Hanom_Chr07g00627941 [Helianthus anomalus]
MAYEAKAMGFECPSWNVEAWEAKLRDLGGNPVEHPVKPVVEKPAEVAKKVANVNANAGKDAGGDTAVDAGVDVDEAMIEEGAAP